MRWVREVIDEVEVRPTTAVQSNLMAFVWRNTRYVVADRLSVTRSCTPSLVFQRVATADGLVFLLHAERGVRYMLDAVPGLLAPEGGGGVLNKVHDDRGRGGVRPSLCAQRAASSSTTMPAATRHATPNVTRRRQRSWRRSVLVTRALSINMWAACCWSGRNWDQV
jgi:hypothetical protein